MIKKSTDGIERVLSLSYGKDSMACLGALEQLGWSLDRIVTFDVWATDTIQGDTPPQVAFKEYADKIIKERYGIEVEHYYATDKNGEKQTYEKMFYRCYEKGKHKGNIYGFPMQKGTWCNKGLKLAAIKHIKYPSDYIQYIGIAVDEPERIHLESSKMYPLVEIGWTENNCKQWCKENNLLSPIYTDEITRGGCWFCHSASLNELRQVKHKYPELWQKLLKWDSDSPVTFHPDGRTVHDLDKRFELENKGIVPKDKRFRWKMVDEYKEENNVKKS